MTYDVRGKQVINNSLLNISFSDGDMFTGAGERRKYFTEEERNNLTFNSHKWLGGEVVVSYKGEIIYITHNGLKTNYDTASRIKDAIQSGYIQEPALLED